MPYRVADSVDGAPPSAMKIEGSCVYIYIYAKKKNDEGIRPLL